MTLIDCLIWIVVLLVAVFAHAAVSFAVLVLFGFVAMAVVRLVRGERF